MKNERKMNGFVKDLAKIMRKHNAELSIEVDQDYSGYQCVELYFSTPAKMDNLLFEGHKRLVDFNEILEALEE